MSKKIINYLIIFLAIICIVTFFWRERLPDSATMLPAVFEEPVQKEVQKEALNIQKDDYQANIKFLYEYEINGLIVEDYDSEVWYDIMHKYDPFNTKDVCVIWGDNVKNNIYKNVEFSHGEFTCFYRTKSREFNKNQFSNNHLIPADHNLYKKIKKAKLGDQVSIKGYLVNSDISGPENIKARRYSSTVRTDTGNGACEVLYVKDFQVIKQGSPIANGLFEASKVLLAFFIVFKILFFIWEIARKWNKYKLS